MRFLYLILILIPWAGGFAQQPSKPLTPTQVMELVAAGAPNERLAQAVQERGIDFALSAEFLSELREKGALPVLIQALGSLDLKTQTVPLDKELVFELVKAGVDAAILAEALRDRGVDFQPTRDDLRILEGVGAPFELLRAIRGAAPRPLAREKLLKLLVAGVSKERVATLVERCGIDFKPTPESLDSLRIAGADDAVIEAVRKAKRTPDFLLRHEFEAYPMRVESLAFSHDGRTLASVGYGTVAKLWQVGTGNLLRELKVRSGSPKYSVAFDPTGRYLASGNTIGEVLLWDLKSSRPARPLAGQSGSVKAVAFSADGRYLAAAARDGVALWNPETRKLIRRLNSPNGSPRCIAFAPQDSLLASGGMNGNVELWNPNTGEVVRTLSGHRGEVFTVTFSPDGKLLAAAGQDQNVLLWETATGTLLRTLAGSERMNWCVAFSPDGRFVASASYDGMIRIWDVATGVTLRTLEHGNDSTSGAVVFSPDGKYLASTSRGKIRLWQRED